MAKARRRKKEPLKECLCAGPNYDPDVPCPVHPKNGPHRRYTNADFDVETKARFQKP